MKTLNAKVKFVNDFDKNSKGEKHYDYLTYMDGLEEGDLVVVQTKYGFSVAEFVRYVVETGRGKCHIVAKIDMTGYYEITEKEDKIKRLKQQIDERAKKVLQRKKLDELAVDDQELKTMLDTFDSLEA
ncbi:hypothetical protein HBP99_04115 [Listeria booriae]|uniref:hypothetical protein n=1 Tax=Listeria booriae TaxID=1552123 RepID=UPI001626494E|nr:hypothetical protein [Listeria booriae]MBC2367805.1 hypothetical protein [Listeria booriae]